MSQTNPLIIEINEVIEKFSNKKAIIYYENDSIVKELLYKDVGEISEVIKTSLDEFQGSFCGLFMDHNLFIPSIIIGLQKLNCPFSFLKINELKTSFFNNIDIILTLNDEFNELNNSNYLFKKKIDLICNYKLNVYEFKDFDVKRDKKFIKNINYVVETSGTTGSCKQILVEYYCIYSNVKDLREKLKITQQDVIYLQTNLTFDPSMIELYLPLTTGASLLIVSNLLRRDYTKLFNILFKKQLITFLQICPSLFLRYSPDEIDYILNKSSLKILLLGGEDFPKSLLTCIINKSNNADVEKNIKIFNIYGITEVSCWSSIEEINFQEEINLGRPLNDTFFEVRNENGIKIDQGEGELFIGSFNRICYLNDNESISLPLIRKTGDLVSIENNRIVYKGRLDDIFKRFGVKINLNQIENEIYDLINLENKLIYLEEISKLILFVELDEQDPIIIGKICDKIRFKLLHELKKEYFPDFIEGLTRFRLTKNGKIDKYYLRKLSDSVMNKNRNLNNSNNLNKELDIFKTLWIKYLRENNQEKSFYELGGSSILRIQFTNEFKQLMDNKINLPTQFFDYLFTNSYEKVIEFIENYQFKTFNVNKKLKTYHNGYQLNIKWNYDLKGCIDSTPCINNTKKLITIGSFSNNLATLNLETGEELFKITLPNAIESACTSTNSGELIIIGCYDGCLYCINIIKKIIVWRYQTEDKIKNKPILIDDETKIVFGSYDKHLYCLKTTDGELIWKLLLNSAITSDYLFICNLLFVSTINGECFLIDFKDGKILNRIKLENPIFSSPCLINNALNNGNIEDNNKENNQIIIATVQGEIYCLIFNKNEIAIVHKLKLNTNVYSSLTTVKNLIFFTSHDGFLYSLEIVNNSSRLKFKIQLDSSSSSSVAIKEDLNRIYLITASTNGFIYLIDFQEAIILNKIQLKAEIFSSPVIYCNENEESNNLLFLLFIGCRDNQLYCIEVNKEV